MGVPHAGASLDYLLLVAGVHFNKVYLGRAWSMRENERLTLNWCLEYLRNGSNSTEHCRVRIVCDLLGFAGPRIPSELNQWILRLHLYILIRE